MLSRFKALVRPGPRRLLLACLYMLYFILLVTFFIDGRHAFTGLDLGVLVPATVLLGAGFTHSLWRGLRENFTDESSRNGHHNDRRIVRNSTHNTVNSLLMFGSSAGFLAYDSLLLAHVVPLPANLQYGPVAVRTAGMGLWNLASGVMLFRALAHDRRQENNPDQQIRALGMHPATYDLSAELLLFAASACIGYEFYNETPLNPFKCSAVIFWWAAASFGSLAAGYDWYHRNNVVDAIEMNVLPVIVAGEPMVVVVEPPGTYGLGR